MFNGRKSSKRTKQTTVKGPWGKDEDDVVIRLVGQYGPKRWSLIASNLPGRTGKQCRERWHNQLDPNIKREEWTEEEDRILIDAHKKASSLLAFGNHWVGISKLLPGRTDNAIKNRWNSTMSKMNLLCCCCSSHSGQKNERCHPPSPRSSHPAARSKRLQV
ncbi:hypothetical protein GUITHDRAFT_68537 [Guillardia theta CCMP2712]|uniref:Uncharacterized protein n=1 Tax=Guillardia theta (strain CCMP2712) TaxID=905079 RepID=L1JLD2_GUITC|nr:hypothetical protein GUITHDRAFT_68537 [Guillardia theta CCMP2712]EKX48900.1 hypothetical protein GUITHDRAFT_68537 [Guillardia theta CCMP2712]|eukprot:XP_005835880.1 hypothetical protein GUITHDRAFT_68537 [Guillardia theta CCMP2712]